MSKIKNEQKIKTDGRTIGYLSKNKMLSQKRFRSLRKNISLLNIKIKRTKNLNDKETSTIFGQIAEFFGTTTLHGLRYIVDTSISLCERLFWLTAFIAVIGFATYNITGIYKKWITNSILVSISPYDADIKEFPFPAITICNMNQAGQPCRHMLKSCKWKNNYVNCSEYFINYLTDEGLCCSFNRLPPEYILRDPNTTVFDQIYDGEVYDWTPERGFDKAYQHYSAIPRRPIGPGVDLGLTVLLDTETTRYYCSSTNSVGFKVSVSNPIENPRMTDFSTLIGPGLEIRYQLVPLITEATEDLRTVLPEDRQCYFSHERELRYYKTYTDTNCQLECFSNLTLKRCKCVPYFLPRHESMDICGLIEGPCILNAKEELEQVVKNRSVCDCLSSCFQISFSESLSYNDLSSLSVNYIRNRSEDYIQDNMAQVHFFFKEKTFQVDIKSRLYGFTEILANVGGLLGLCLGFSFLSLMEIIYFVGLKLVHLIRKLLKNLYEKNNSIETNKKPPHYPFIN